MSQVNSFNIANYKKKLGEDIVIMKDGHLIDAFWGNNGFHEHARFTSKKTNRGIYVTQISGDKIPVDVYKNILTKVGA